MGKKHTHTLLWDFLPSPHTDENGVEMLENDGFAGSYRVMLVLITTWYNALMARLHRDFLFDYN